MFSMNAGMVELESMKQWVRWGEVRKEGREMEWSRFGGGSKALALSDSRHRWMQRSERRASWKDYPPFLLQSHYLSKSGRMFQNAREASHSTAIDAGADSQGLLSSLPNVRIATKQQQSKTKWSHEGVRKEIHTAAQWHWNETIKSSCEFNTLSTKSRTFRTIKLQIKGWMKDMWGGDAWRSFRCFKIGIHWCEFRFSNWS